MLQKHVNTHLDSTEQQQSTELAKKLHAQQVELNKESNQHQQQDAAIALAIQDSENTNSSNPTKSKVIRGHLSDSAETYYPQILNRLSPYLEQGDGFRSRTRHLCSSIDLFSSNIAGLGWDCGYRNIQILFSSLFYQSRTATSLRQSGIPEVPSVPEIAGRIEEAWRRGFDRESAKAFGGVLTGKEVWIGANEAYILLESLGIRAIMNDFITRTDQERHQMFEWVFKHFNDHCDGRHCRTHRRLGFNQSEGFIPPIFCQWQGHSITIVGATKTKATGEIELIVVDPARSFYASIIHNPSNGSVARRSISHHQLAHPRFQLVTVATATPQPTVSQPPQEQQRGKLLRAFCLKS